MKTNLNYLRNVHNGWDDKLGQWWVGIHYNVFWFK